MKLLTILVLVPIACAAEDSTSVRDFGSWVEHGEDHTATYEAVELDTLGAFNPSRPECLIAPTDGVYDIKASAVWSVNKFGTRELGLWVERAGGPTQMIAPLEIELGPDDVSQVIQFIEATEVLGSGDCVFVKAEHTAREKKGNRKPKVGLNFGVVSFWMARR